MAKKSKKNIKIYGANEPRTVNLYKVKEGLSKDLEINLDFEVQYNPQEAINNINNEYSERDITDDISDLLNNYCEGIYLDSETNTDSYDKPIYLYKWSQKTEPTTGQQQGFKYFEAFPYNLGSNMFRITLSNNLTLALLETPEQFKPIFLEEVE